MLKNKRILLLISGGIAAYKSLELIRLIKKSDSEVKCILTHGGSQFVTPLSISALSNEKCYMDLWNIDDEMDMGHIQLSRWADIIVVAPATANIMAKMAHGMADDLASTCLLATNKPVMIAPAMNPEMWSNQATQDNLKILKNRNIQIIQPAEGDMACGETGTGRMVEAEEIFQSIMIFFQINQPLSGKTAIVTAGPTYEPIDPVRFIGNRSSGKQGYAIAQSLRDAGADVTLISGPTALPYPDGIKTIRVEKAIDMMNAVENNLPTDIAICAAAVADYGVEQHVQKQKKSDGDLKINLTENPDILHTTANHKNRPNFVVGFAAETENLVDNARAKLNRKNCDALIANNVASGDIFGTDTTSIHWITNNDHETYNDISKSDVGDMIIEKIINHYNSNKELKIA